MQRLEQYLFTNLNTFGQQTLEHYREAQIQFQRTENFYNLTLLHYRREEQILNVLNDNVIRIVDHLVEQHTDNPYGNLDYRHMLARRNLYFRHNPNQVVNYREITQAMNSIVTTFGNITNPLQQVVNQMRTQQHQNEEHYNQ